ncbi:MAG: InlB B-repeat-containing protein [Bulleidia sp.]
MHIWKRIVTALLAVLLCVGIVPVNVKAEQISESKQAQLYVLDLNPTGGTILEGDVSGEYESGSHVVLPEVTQMEKPGYEFSGWYDHPDCTGNAYTVLNIQESTVLYARWIERYYTFTIPDNMEVQGGKQTSVSVHTGGFYADDRVDLSVSSGNQYQLINGDDAIPYSLSKTEQGDTVTDGVIGTFHQDGTQNLYVQVDTDAQPVYAGTYADTLTFRFAFQESAYGITYIRDGGVFNVDAFDENRVYPAGTKLDFLPDMVKEDAVFIGWCYDKNRTRYVQDDDLLTGNIALYASYQDTKDLEVHRYDTYARAVVEAGKADSFTVSVCAGNQAEISDEIVKNGVIVKNVSSIEESEQFEYSENATGAYVIRPENGWEEGADYRVVLQDERLCFTGYDPTITEYDIQFEMPEVMNFSLNDQIRYISRNDITDLVVNGEQQSTIDIAVMTAGEEGNETGSDTSGSFRYSSELKAGDQIAIYEGNVIPTLNGKEDTFCQQDISFLEVTAVEGDTVYYRGAAVEDVMGTPDTLYVKNNNDIQEIRMEDMDNAYILQIPVEKLTYDGTGEHDQELGLDQDTTVDAGDFIMWADENNEAVIYEIQTVQVENGIYTLSCLAEDTESIMDCMDVYQKEPVSGETILEDVDTEHFEKDIEQQAVTSGFVNEVADEIAAMTMATDSYQQLQKEMKAAFGTDVTMSMVSSSNILLEATGKAGKKVEVELTKVRANLSTRLEHFANVSGVRLALELDFKVKIHVNDNADIEILVTTEFEQEVRIDLSVKGKAIWKWKWIFPYIADYQLTASAELYEYTGFDFNANFKTKEAEEDDENNTSDRNLTKRQKTEKFCTEAAKELKKLMDTGTKYVTDNADITTHLEDLLEEEQMDNGREISIAKSLGEQYAALLEDDADWCEIYSKKMWGHEVRILLIFAVEMKLEFVISGMMNVTLGITYWYENAKKYVYTLSVASGKVTSDTIDLVEEKYEFSAYAVGTIGIRAGVKFTFAVGIFTTKLASVGISAEVGGYVQLWGYLYYYYRYSASNGRTSSGMGSLYLEIGVYIEVEFEAQAFAGTFVFNPTLLDVQWPLYTVGSIYSTLDFSYEQSDLEQIIMKKNVTSAVLPDDLFTMNCIHMKEGMDDEEYYQRSYQPDEHFNITMTNTAFTYNTKTNQVSVNPGSSREQNGEMIITWIPQEGSFFTKPLSRTISLHWDQYRDAYSITFDSKGGSLVSSIVEPYNTPVQAPQNPTKAGYRFAGWKDENGSPVSIPSTMPAEDLTLYASWVPDVVSVTVMYYLETENGSYRLNRIEKDTVINGSTYTAPLISYAGYAQPDQQSRVITKGGNTVFTYQYARNSYTMTFLSENEVISSRSQRYDTSTYIPNPIRPGYQFAGWDQTVPERIPAQDMTFHALWKAQSCDYQVRHYLETVNGWQIGHVEYGKGSTDATVTAQAMPFEGYTPEQDSVSGTVKADGSLVLRLYYERNPYTVTLINGEQQETISQKPGFVLQDLPVPEKKGYDFTGWYADKTCTVQAPEIMPENSLTLYAGWKEVYVEYTVEHWIEDIDGASVLESTEQLRALRDHEVKPEVRTYTGLTSPEPVTVTITQNGSNVITYRYTRNTYEMVFMADDQVVVKQPLKYGAKMYIPEAPEKPGYQFTRWDPQIPETVPDHDMEFTAIYTANMYGYQILHYVETLNGYQLKDEESGSAETDTLIQAQAKQYEGYLPPQQLPSASIRPDQTTVLNVYYTLPVYILSLHVNNGSEDQIYAKKRTSPITEIYTPARTGYRFEGWFTDDQYAQPFDMTQTHTMESDLDLYAKWTAESVPVTVRHYVQNIYDDGCELMEQAVVYLPSDSTYTPERKMYEGTDQPDEQTIQVSPDGTSVVEYRYDRKTYQIIVNPDNGEESRQFTVRHGSTLSLDQPVKEGYTFTGWDHSIPEHVTSDLTFTALYQIITYTLKFRVDEKIIQETQYAYGSKISYPAVPVREGYTGSWNQAITTMPADDTTIEAVYTPVLYSITYDLNGGSPDKELMDFYHIESETITLPSVMKPGFTFIGWSGTGLESPQLNPTVQTGSTGNRSYRAEFQENTYRIVFEAGTDASGTMEHMHLTYTQSAQLPENGFTKTGYRMIGWSRKANASTPDFINNQNISGLTAENDGTVTLYAVWRIYTTEITLISNLEGVEDRKMTVEYGSEEILWPLSHPDYEFAGYSMEKDGTVVYRIHDIYQNNTEADSEVTLYGVWLKNPAEKNTSDAKQSLDGSTEFIAEKSTPLKIHIAFGHDTDHVNNQTGYSSYTFSVDGIRKDAVSALGKKMIMITMTSKMSSSPGEKEIAFTRRINGEWQTMPLENGQTSVTTTGTINGDVTYIWRFPIDPDHVPDMICFEFYAGIRWSMENVNFQFSFM